MEPRIVKFYLDFISPYTWLALMQAEHFAARHGVQWELHPVVYAALLDAHGLIGPVETLAKRGYTFQDVARLAHSLGLRLTGPAEHPFRSLRALGALSLFRRQPQALALAVALSDACWGSGRNLADIDVIRDVVASVGLDMAGLENRLSTIAVKQDLRDLTAEALRIGVFGVPTFVSGDEIFWGHDRMDLLAAFVEGKVPEARHLIGDLLERPRGVDRSSKTGKEKRPSPES